MFAATSFTGSIPQNYDFYLGPLFFEPYALDLVSRIHNKPTAVLELACGTGRVTKHLVNALAANGKLCATDLNMSMLQIAKERLSDPRIEWSVADAHELPFAVNSFDLVVCQFGVMFFAEKPQALNEIWRVLKPGGCFLFNTWGRLEKNAAANLTSQALHEIFPEDPPAFLEKVPHSMTDPEAIKRLLQEANFTQIKTENVALASTSPSPDDVIKGILDGTPTSLYLKERPARDGALRQRLRELLVQQYGEKNLRLPMEAIFCEAVKP